MKPKIKIIGCTGHRKISHDENNLKTLVRDKLRELKPDVVITGMAIGFDMLVAEACIEENIPFVAAIPCIGQTKFWTKAQKGKYVKLVSKAWKVTIISKGNFTIQKLFLRNCWIVNKSHGLIAYWDERPMGGTYSCLQYAKKKNCPHDNLYGIL